MRGAPPSAMAASTPNPPVATGGTTLGVASRQVAGRDYLEITQMPPRVALRLERPSESDARNLVCVPGTYTSPEGRVEGAVVLDGRIVQSRAMPWQGLLVIERGAPEVRWSRDGAATRELLESIARRGGSAIQGHLLVGDGRAQPLKQSAALRRRAIATYAEGRFAIVESQGPLELARFAEDLVLLGAKLALNLDMGPWSEGFYRHPRDGSRVRLGDDFRETARQTNWLVMIGEQRR